MAIAAVIKENKRGRSVREKKRGRSVRGRAVTERSQSGHRAVA
jgi:hypothetical protein